MRKFIVCITFLYIIATVAIIYAQKTDKTTGWSYCPYCGNYLGPQKDYGMGHGFSGGRGMMDSGIGPINKRSWYDYEKGHMMMKQSTACQNFLDETVELRKELNDKRFLYHEAIRDPESTKDELAKLEDDLKELQGKLSEKRPLECIW